MAEVRTVTVLDDIEKKEGRDVEAEHADVSFMLDGRHYEIDLCVPNYQALTEALEPFLRAARRQPGRTRAASGSVRPVPNREEAKVVRAWAAENGWPEQKDARGRIPHVILDAFAKRHRNGAAPRPEPVVEPEPKPIAATPPSFATQKDANQAIRDFVRAQGITVSTRGAIPKEFREMYRQAHGGDPIIDE